MPGKTTEVAELSKKVDALAKAVLLLLERPIQHAISPEENQAIQDAKAALRG